MTWPSPPRFVPGPPESVRYSLRRINSGDVDSVTSTGMLRTPLGNAVADSPSLPGRAPVPPEWKLLMLNGSASISASGGASTALGPPIAIRFHRHDEPSA